MKSLFAVSLVAALALAGVGAAPAAEFSPAQKDEIGVVVKDYLIAHPEVLRQALDALDKHEKQAEVEAREKIVADQSSLLFSSPYQATIGNPKGGATLVEFFDYNCHFCKGALPDIARLMKDDPNLKVVLKDFLRSRTRSWSKPRGVVATAVRNQLSGDKFWQQFFSIRSCSACMARSARPKPSRSPKSSASIWTG